MVHRGFRSSAAVVAATSAAFVAFSAPAAAQPGSADPASLLPPGFPCIHTNVYPFPVAEWGWGPSDGSPPRYVQGPPGASGTGSLDMYTPAGQRTNYFHPGISTPLPDLTNTENSLGYMHRGEGVSFQLRIRGAETGSLGGFTTLVWSPNYNGFTGSTDWIRSGNLAAGQWWTTRTIAGLPENFPTATLKQIADANPNSTVTEYGVQVGTESSTRQGNADDVIYGCARWDFEPLPSGSG